MPFEHGATTEWGRWLRRVFAGRPPGTQVVGQDIEDALRGTVQVADLNHLTTPIGWAQAAARRQTNGVAAEVARVELHCQSEGGLWVEALAFSTSVYVIEIIDAPLSVPDRTLIVDFGVIPTVSLMGSVSVAEAVPPALPQRPGGGFDQPFPTAPIYVPFGKVIVFRKTTQNSTINLEYIGWREIPAAR